MDLEEARNMIKIHLNLNIVLNNLKKKKIKLIL